MKYWYLLYGTTYLPPNFAVELAYIMDILPSGVDMQAKELCEERGILLVGAKGRASTAYEGQWMYGTAPVERVIEAYGEDMAWLVLYALTEIENAPRHLNQFFLLGLADALHLCPTWKADLGQLCDKLEELNFEVVEPLVKKGTGPRVERRGIVAGFLLAHLMEDDA